MPRRTRITWIARVTMTTLAATALHTASSTAVRGAEIDLTPLIDEATSSVENLEATVRLLPIAGRYSSKAATRVDDIKALLDDISDGAADQSAKLSRIGLQAAVAASDVEQVAASAAALDLANSQPEHAQTALLVEIRAAMAHSALVTLAGALVDDALDGQNALPHAVARQLALRASLERTFQEIRRIGSSLIDQPANVETLRQAGSTLQTLTSRTWHDTTQFHQWASMAVGVTDDDQVDLCVEPSTTCLSGWADSGEDPRVAMINQALLDGDAATAAAYDDAHDAYFPLAVRDALQDSIDVQNNILAIAATQVDTTNNDAVTTTASGSRDTNGHCCATTPTHWEKSGTLYFYYCYSNNSCSYPAGMNFELDTNVVYFRDVPYTGYFTRAYGPSIWLSRYEVPMREDIAGGSDSTKAQYDCGIGSLPLSCYSTKQSPTRSGRYYFNETRVTGRPNGWWDRSYKWQTRRWVPYSSTHATFPAYYRGG